MKVIKYSYKFRIKPNNDQEIKLNKFFGSVRWSYNYFLNQRINEYENNKKSLTYNKQSAFLTQLKKNEETNWLKETNSQTLQYTLKCLDVAFKNFFNKKSKFPRFKKKNYRNSFTIPQHIKHKGKKIFFPKFNEGIDMIMERKIEGTVKRATVSKTSSGKYYITILTEKTHIPVQKTEKQIGLDLGLKDFIILSNGLKIKNHRFIKKYEKQLKINQQHLSRKTKESRRYKKQRIKVAKIHEKISNCRLDLIHKTTLNLIKEFDVIYIENLNVKEMMKNKKLSKAISDVSWGKFIETLKYKAEWNDKEIVKIGRYFPSSKTCSNCGFINHNLSLNIRKWECPKCNKILDRDTNAAINILKEGYKIKLAGTADHKRGAKIRPLIIDGISNETLKEKELLN